MGVFDAQVLLKVLMLLGELRLFGVTRLDFPLK
jgi:hypothetical protein